MCHNLHGSTKAIDLNARDGEIILKARMEKYNYTDYDCFKNFCGKISKFDINGSFDK